MRGVSVGTEGVVCDRVGVACTGCAAVRYVTGRYVRILGGRPRVCCRCKAAARKSPASAGAVTCPDCGETRTVSRNHALKHRHRPVPCLSCSAKRRRLYPAAGPCRHCRASAACRPRGLCWQCYYTPAVQALYPAAVTGTARRGVGNGNAGVRLPDKPTTAPPGTPEKLKVMSRRAKDDRCVFHPADARFAGDRRPLEWGR